MYFLVFLLHVSVKWLQYIVSDYIFGGGLMTAQALYLGIDIGGRWRMDWSYF